jgi:hypothetical protein
MMMMTTTMMSISIFDWDKRGGGERSAPSLITVIGMVGFGQLFIFNFQSCSGSIAFRWRGKKSRKEGGISIIKLVDAY